MFPNAQKPVLKPCPVCGVAMQSTTSADRVDYRCERCDVVMTFATTKPAPRNAKPAASERLVSARQRPPTRRPS